MIVSKAARVTVYRPRFESSQNPGGGDAKSRLKSKAPRYEKAANSFLEQAEVCREQARDAANLKRFHAALGLFATAATLCRHAVTLETDASATLLIQDQLQQIEVEAATYYELARSREKSQTGYTG